MGESALGVGDQYLVQLSIAGKWRSVTWENVEVAGESSMQMMINSPMLEGIYYITSSWNLWALEEMVRDSTQPGLWTYEVRLLRDGGEFQVVRNGDRAQTFYPAGQGFAAGPDLNDAVPEYAWSLDGKAGDVFRIEFLRDMCDDIDVKKVTWKMLRKELLGPDERLVARQPRYCIEGTFTEEGPQEMVLNIAEHRYEYTLEVGRRGTESFHILREGLAYQTIAPDVQNANPYQGHEVLGPGLFNGNNWTIGHHEEELGSARVLYEMRFRPARATLPGQVTWKALGRAEESAQHFVAPVVITERESEV